MVYTRSIKNVVALVLLRSTEAHEVVLTLYDAVPDFNKFLHVIRRVLLASITWHVHNNQFALHVESLSPNKTISLHLLPILIGVTLCEVEVTIHLTTLNVDVHILIISEVLTIVVGTTDIVYEDVVLTLIEDDVQSLLQVIVLTRTTCT